MSENRQDKAFDFFGKPYQNLGREIKKIRTSQKRTVLDVSSAVEINPTSLTQIESGQLKPSQETISLLINHFNLPTDEAKHIWQLAGYEPPAPIEEDEESLEDYIEGLAGLQSKQIMLAVNDQRVFYTDIVNVRANNYGVVISFLQGGSTQPTLINRFGMGLEHARDLVQAINQAISGYEKQNKNEDDQAQTKKAK